MQLPICEAVEPVCEVAIVSCILHDEAGDPEFQDGAYKVTINKKVRVKVHCECSEGGCNVEQLTWEFFVLDKDGWHYKISRTPNGCNQVSSDVISCNAGQLSNGIDVIDFYVCRPGVQQVKRAGNREGSFNICLKRGCTVLAKFCGPIRIAPEKSKELRSNKRVRPESMPSFSSDASSTNSSFPTTHEDSAPVVHNDISISASFDNTLPRDPSSTFRGGCTMFLDFTQREVQELLADDFFFTSPMRSAETLPALSVFNPIEGVHFKIMGASTPVEEGCSYYFDATTAIIYKVKDADKKIQATYHFKCKDNKWGYWWIRNNGMMHPYSKLENIGGFIRFSSRIWNILKVSENTVVKKLVQVLSKSDTLKYPTIAYV